MTTFLRRMLIVLIMMALLSPTILASEGYAAVDQANSSTGPQPINTSKQAVSQITSDLGDQSFAAQSLNSTNSVVLDYGYVKTKPDEAPFTVNVGGETISTLSGSLSMSVADFSLPGRNGLGFTLERKYDSDASQFNQMVLRNGSNTTIQPAEEKLFPIGKGWSWDLSYIEISGSDRYLHLAGSGVFKIDTDNKLIGYPWKDLTLAADTSVTVDGVPSTYVLKSLQKINQYFNSQGQLIQISDSYNNKILFTYVINTTYGSVLSSITDSIGNKIQIDYSPTKVTLTKGTQQVIYYKTIQNGKELLTQVSDRLGRVTTYDYTIKDALFSLNGTTPSVSNPYALLVGVTFPTGAKSAYTYESTPVTRKIGLNAANQAYRVQSREDRYLLSDNSTKVVNHKDITYSGDMGSSYNTDLTFTAVINDGLTKTTYTNEKDYIDDSQPAVYYHTKDTEVSTYNNKTYTSTTDYTYDRARYWPAPVIVRNTKSESGSSGSYYVETSNAYDDYGNVISSTDPLGVQTTYTFDATSHLLVGVSKPVSATQVQYVQYVRDSTHGAVTATRVRNGDVNGAILQETLNSGFDSYGNITQMKLLRNSGDYTAVNITYNSSAPYMGAFPTGTSVAVHNADNLTSTVTRQYTYNAADGTLLSSTDGQNNTTAYQYDALGEF